MRIHVPEIDNQLQEFLADPKLPLGIFRYSDERTIVPEWEVYYDKEPDCGYCIAAFTTWREAYDWAFFVAEGAHRLFDITPRRWNYCYRPDGTWGGFGYWEPTKEEA